MKHRVILTLDADQLSILHNSLGVLYDSLGSRGTLHDNYPKLRDMITTALEVCENRDRANEAERKLSQLGVRSVMQ